MSPIRLPQNSMPLTPKEEPTSYWAVSTFMESPLDINENRYENPETRQTMIVNLSEAKTRLSELIDRVSHGEKMVIAEDNVPIADLVPHRSSGKRELGFLKGELDVPDEVFLEADEDVENMFHEDDDRSKSGAEHQVDE